MASAKKTTKPSIPPSGTTRLFSGRKSGERSASVTSERIADDLAAFRKSGGRIEVLGNTRALKRIGVTEADAPSDTPKKDAAKSAKG